MRASPAIRSLRTAVFAAVCVLLAVAGHALATGAAPPVPADGAGFVGVFVLGWPLAGRERSQAGICGAMAAVQAALHVLFGAAPARLHGAMSAHPHSMGHTHALTYQATAAHLAAALVASWWLRRGEAALWAVLRWAVARMPGLAAWWRAPVGPLPATARVGTGRDAGPWPSHRILLRHSVSRRGPPTENPYASRPQHALTSTEFSHDPHTPHCPARRAPHDPGRRPRRERSPGRGGRGLRARHGPSRQLREGRNRRCPDLPCPQ
ncbi:hypothetical protein ACFPK5_37290 [Streptomyces beijiangensis]|uniref:hypothetical protein n=1 Tax=Streptomyces beijiangensis TaxID=163361 RepID=UPI00360C8F5A